MGRARKKAAEMTSVCFRCDGTGKICNICGESPNACGCDESEVQAYHEVHGMDQFDNCEDCKGTGK